jgi:hypothetical protein
VRLLTEHGSTNSLTRCHSFESREICEEVIKKFHGHPLGHEALLLQVRYADTAGQKQLKRITTERRQFRTTEYNVSAYGGSPELLALHPLPSRQFTKPPTSPRQPLGAHQRENTPVNGR